MRIPKMPNDVGSATPRSGGSPPAGIRFTTATPELVHEVTKHYAIQAVPYVSNADTDLSNMAAVQARLETIGYSPAIAKAIAPHVAELSVAEAAAVDREADHG